MRAASAWWPWDLHSQQTRAMRIMVAFEIMCGPLLRGSATAHCKALAGFTLSRQERRSFATRCSWQRTNSSMNAVRSLRWLELSAT